MVAVVIPCYKVRMHLLDLIRRIGPEVDRIYVVDDGCPEGSGRHVLENCPDQRVLVIFNEKNLGVGGAVKAGYRKAMEEKATVVVKLDGDGQMDPALIPWLIAPVIQHKADYVKGNRFYDISFLRQMPLIRRFGNSMISFITKLVTGYWNIMDPANGFTAIHVSVLKHLSLDKIDNRFFFESDMLFRLYTVRAVVQDMPMRAVYSGEKSNLSVTRVLFRFPGLYLNRMLKRITYNYFIRDFNIGSLELVIAMVLLGFGIIFGGIKWLGSIESTRPASAGTVLLAGLPVILGFQAFLSFLHFDLVNLPQKPVSSLENPYATYDTVLKPEVNERAETR